MTNSSGDHPFCRNADYTAFMIACLYHGLPGYTVLLLSQFLNSNPTFYISRVDTWRSEYLATCANTQAVFTTLSLTLFLCGIDWIPAQCLHLPCF